MNEQEPEEVIILLRVIIFIIGLAVALVGILTIISASTVRDGTIGFTEILVGIIFVVLGVAPESLLVIIRGSIPPIRALDRKNKMG